MAYICKMHFRLCIERDCVQRSFCLTDAVFSVYSAFEEIVAFNIFRVLSNKCNRYSFCSSFGFLLKHI